jgi:hypothetical protein
MCGSGSGSGIRCDQTESSLLRLAPSAATFQRTPLCHLFCKIISNIYRCLEFPPTARGFLRELKDGDYTTC